MPSETTATTSATGAKSSEKPALTAPRTPIDRLRLMAVCLGFAAAAAFWSVGQPYYTMNMSDVAVTTESMRDVDGVTATASVTGRQLVAQPDNAPTIGTGANLANDSTPAGYFGMPNAVVLLLIAAIAGIIATTMCSTIAAIIGCAFAFFAFRSFGALTALVENSSTGGSLVSRGGGLQLLQFSLIIICATVLAAAAQTAMVAVERRAYRKALAKAENREPDLTLVDWLRGAAAAGTSMVETHARQKSTERAGRENSKTS